jgi:hypothetical protein
LRAMKLARRPEQALGRHSYVDRDQHPEKCGLATGVGCGCYRAKYRILKPGHRRDEARLMTQNQGSPARYNCG